MEVLQYFMTNFVQLIPATSKYEEDVEEEVNDVQVDIEGSEDVFLRAERVGVCPPHHELSVVHKVAGEYQSPGNANTNHRPPTNK